MKVTKIGSTKKENLAPIEITPSWGFAVEICIIGLEHGTAEGKKLARMELREIGKTLDVLLERGGA